MLTKRTSLEYELKMLERGNFPLIPLPEIKIVGRMARQRVTSTLCHLAHVKLRKPWKKGKLFKGGRENGGERGKERQRPRPRTRERERQRQRPRETDRQTDRCRETDIERQIKS